MGFNALFRLIWRQVTILHVLSLGLAFVLVLLLYKDEPFPGAPRPGRLNFFTLLFSALVGDYLGQGVCGLQHTLFSWTLPNLRRRLFFSLLFVGIVTAFIVTWVYKWFDGPAPWLPIFTSVLLWYSMGLAFGMNQVRGIPRPHILLYGALALLVAAGFSINRIADLYGTQTLLCVLLTTLGASLYLHRIFDINAARGNSLVSIKEMMAWKGISRRKWQHTGPITGLFNWIRAGEYENFGSTRGGWPAVAVGLSGVAVLIVTAMAYYKGYERGSHEMGIQFIYHTIFDSSSFKKNMTVLVSAFPVLCAGAYSIIGSLFPQNKGWLYPLSRTQLARLAYWSSLLYNAVFCGILLLAFFLIQSLVGLYAGYDAHFKSIPDCIRPVTLIFIATPLIQWLRLYVQSAVWLFVFLLLWLGVGVLGAIWLEAAPDISDLYEVAAGAGLILLSQCLFRYKVETYFRRGDLV